MRETRRQLKERLTNLGRWHEYLAIRARLRSEGKSAAAARLEAIRQIDAHETIAIEVTEGEQAAWETAAKEKGKSLNDWVHSVLDGEVTEQSEEIAVQAERSVHCVICTRGRRVGTPIPPTCLECDRLAGDRSRCWWSTD